MVASFKFRYFSNALNFAWENEVCVGVISARSFTTDLGVNSLDPSRSVVQEGRLKFLQRRNSLLFTGVPTQMNERALGVLEGRFARC